MSDKESDGEHVFFRDRPEWSDVVPISLNDSADSPCRIIYSQQYEDAMGYLRAILLSGEKTPRVLELLDFIVRYNPSLYTAWKCRYDCLIELKSDLHRELDFVEKLALENPKNYQIWGHRRLISDLIPDGERELRFSDALLKKDPKNYHSWSYRVYIAEKYNLWDKELENTRHFIEEDAWNNSAWSRRYYVYKHLYPNPSDSELSEEISFAASKMLIHGDNPPPFIYCQSLLEAYGKTLDSFPELENALLSLKDSFEGKRNSLSFLIDYYLRTRTKMGEAISMIETMIKVDPIRASYWMCRMDDATILQNQ